jgi:hypothetical protein
MPDLNPSYLGHNVRIDGKWGAGATALSLGTTSYVAGYISNSTPGDGVGGVPCAASSGPFCNSQAYEIGDAPRTGAFGLRSPSSFRLTSGLRRTFDIREGLKFIFGVDCQNVTNAVTFGINAGNLEIPAGVNTATFGTLNYASSDSRDFQLSGRLSF